MEPLSFFGNTMHTESADLKIVQSLRKWTSSIFQKSNVLSSKYITQLDQVQAVSADKEGYDFDL